MSERSKTRQLAMVGMVAGHVCRTRSLVCDQLDHPGKDGGNESRGEGRLMPAALVRVLGIVLSTWLLVSGHPLAAAVLAAGAFFTI